MKIDFKVPTVPNFILGKVGSNEIKLAVNEMEEEDLKEIIRRWETEVWLQFHKPKIHTR